MPLEQNVISLGLLLLAIVAATMAGGLVGRRIRSIRERRAARAGLAARIDDHAAGAHAAGAAIRATPPPVATTLPAAVASAPTPSAPSVVAQAPATPPGTPQVPAVAAAPFP